MQLIASSFHILLLFGVLTDGTYLNEQEQGITGHVYRVSGNQMPGPGVPSQGSKPLSTTIYIFELTNLSQVVRKGQSAFYSSIHSRLIEKVRSDSTGYFKVLLPVGRFSLFTKVNQLYYANSFDGTGNISAVDVHPHQITPLRVVVDYDATY